MKKLNNVFITGYDIQSAAPSKVQSTRVRSGPEGAGLPLSLVDPLEVRTTGYCSYRGTDSVEVIKEIGAKKSEVRYLGDMMRLALNASFSTLRMSRLDVASLDTVDIYSACGAGEPDSEFISTIVSQLEKREQWDEQAIHSQLNADLQGVRPTLFLAQLPNLLASNISIILGVKGRSLTFLGLEAAGASAFDRACNSIEAGLADQVLVGGASNYTYEEALITFAAEGYLPGLGRHNGESPPRPSDIICSSGISAFLMLESRAAIEKRGGAALAKVERCIFENAPPTENGERRFESATDLFGQLSGRKFFLYNYGKSGRELGAPEDSLRAFLTRAKVPFQTIGEHFGASFEAAVPLSLALTVHSLRCQEFMQPWDDQTWLPEYGVSSILCRDSGEMYVVFSAPTDGGND